jgi:DNA-binding IclR family transcriptional regulator
LPAAFVYEALEQGRGRMSSFELSKGTDMARSTVYEALQTLVAFNLVQQRAGRWSIVATTSLVVLAETLGCAAEIVDRLHRHRRERDSFRRAMHVVAYLETAVEEEFYDPVIAGTESALDVLERILGARRLA